MHRSGTSALAGTLQRLGFRIPEPQLATTPDNPFGFYENVLVRDFNEHVLDLAASSWHDPLPVSTSRLAAHRADIDARLVGMLQSDEFLAPCLLKDPRFCVNVDIWLDGLGRCDRTVGCILMARHPAAVAASLRARNGLSIAHSLTLWLKYMLSAEELTRGRLRTVVVYDDLLRDWRGTVGRTVAALGLDPVAEADGRPVDAFLRGDLRHHPDPDDFGAHNALEQACLATWQCFLDLAANGEDQATLRRLADLEARYAESVSLLTPLLDGLLDRRTVVPANQPGFDGMRLRTADQPDVWLVYHGERHRIASPEVYEAFFTGVDAVVTVDSVAGIEAGSTLADGACLLRAEGRDAIYLVNRVEAHAVLRHHIASYRTFMAFGFDLAKVRDVPRLVLDTVPEGRDIRVAEW